MVASDSNTAIRVLLFPVCSVLQPRLAVSTPSRIWRKCRMTKERTGAAMRDCTEMFNRSGEHIATIGFNESYGLWQIVVVQRNAPT
jgi:hypothetical protein